MVSENPRPAATVLNNSILVMAVLSSWDFSELPFKADFEHWGPATFALTVLSNH